MKTGNSELMRQAQEALSGKWALAIGTCLVYMIFASINVPLKTVHYEHLTITVFGLGIFVYGPLTVGLAIFALSVSRRQEAEFSMLFDGFNKYWVSVGAYLLVGVFTILWMLLLIVPGIIAAISYSQTFYIIADGNSVSAMEAIDKSKKMMDGYKMKYFLLSLRFLGLALLCILTLGIGFLWLIPYIYVTCARFYDDIKQQDQEPVQL